MASPGWKYSEFCQESVKSENQIFIFITLCPSVQCIVYFLQCIVYCSALQCIVVHCSALQCIVYENP